MNTVCPICNNEDVIQKVSTIASAGQLSGSYSGPTGGVTYSGGKLGVVGGYTSLSGTSASQLAQALAFPKVPTINSAAKIGGIFCMSMGLLSVFLFLVIVPAGFTGSFIDSLKLPAFLIFSIILWFFLANKSFKENNQQLEKLSSQEQQYLDLEKVWARLYYCFRDDIVFDPVTGDSMPPQELNQYLMAKI